MIRAYLLIHPLYGKRELLYFFAEQEIGIFADASDEETFYTSHSNSSVVTGESKKRVYVRWPH
jgi:hypothetical protein